MQHKETAETLETVHTHTHTHTHKYFYTSVSICYVYNTKEEQTIPMRKIAE